MKFFSPATHRLAWVCCSMLLLSGCGDSVTASVLSSGDGNIAGALARHWVRQEIAQTGLSIEFPSLLSVRRMGTGPETFGLYEVSATGTSMYALVRPYDAAVPDSEGLAGLRAAAATEDICALLERDATYPLGIDFSGPSLCRVSGADGWTVVTGIGFVAGAEVSDINGVILFLGPDRTVILDHLFTLSQLSPVSQAMIDDYFSRHPTVTQIWPDQASGKALNRRLMQQMNADIQGPSPWVKNAEAFMARIAESAR